MLATCSEIAAKVLVTTSWRELFLRTSLHDCLGFREGTLTWSILSVAFMSNNI